MIAFVERFRPVFDHYGLEVIVPTVHERMEEEELLPYAEVRSACAGEWKPRGPRTFDVTLYCVWNASWEGAPPTPDRIRMKVTLDKKGRSWTATPFYYEAWADGKYEAWDTWGEMDGKRLGIAPLP